MRREDATAPVTFITAPEVIARRVGPELVVVDLQTDQIYELNHTAGRLWELLAEGRTPTEAEAVLVAEFPDAVPAEVAADVAKTLESLLQQRLIRAI